MNYFDMRTIVLSYMITNVVCVWFIMLLWRQNRRRFAGTTFWAVDFVFQAVALFLIVMRGTIPDWMSIVFSNTLVIVGAILGLMGYERFVGKRGPQIHNYFLVIIFIVIQSYFFIVQPNLKARSLNIAVALLLVCFQAVWLMWRRIDPGMRSMTFGVGAVNFLYCLVSCARIAYYFVTPNVGSNYFQPALFEALVLVFYQVTFILLTYSIVLMVNKRLIMEVGAQEVVLREGKEKARLERDQIELILKTAQDGFWLVDASTGHLVEVNEAASSMLGYTREELLTRGLADIDAQWSPEELGREM